jgi:sodium/proline symporter
VKTNPIYITFALYLCAMIGIGIYTYFRTANYGEYILGGRGLGSWVTAISAQAADFSGWILMGLPGAAYASGLGKTSLYICIFTAIGAMINWKYVAQRLRVFTEQANNSLTISSYLENRFSDRSRVLKVVTSAFIVIFFTGYVAAGFVSGGVLFESLFGVDRVAAILIGAVVIIAYTFLGGFLAVTFTELLQGIIMFSTLMLTPILCIVSAGGVEPVLARIATINPDLLSATTTVDYSLKDGVFWQTTGTVTVVSVVSCLGWGLGYFGQPHILIRFMSIRNHHELVKSRLIALSIGNVFPLYGTIIVGLIGIATYNGPTSLANPETVFITMVKDMFNPWLAGFFLSAIMAAIMSTLSSQLLVAASSFTEDLYRTFWKPRASDRELMFVSRFLVLALSVVAILLSFRGGRILDLVGYAWSGFGACFGPTLLFSLYWKKMTRNGAVAGIVAGGLVVILWPFTGSQLFDIIPGFIASCVAIYLTVILGKPVAPEVAETFERLERETGRRKNA